MMVINLFGIGVKYAVFELPEKIYDSIVDMSKKTNQTITEIVGDLEFWEHFGMSHVFDLKSISKGFGLVKNDDSIFEWKLNRKVLRKINLNYLTNDGLLFPMYNIESKNECLTEIADVKKKKLVILQYSKGQVAKYTIDENIQLEDLSFIFKTIEFESESITFLSDIKKTNLSLKSKTDHSLVTSQRVFMV